MRRRKLTIKRRGELRIAKRIASIVSQIEFYEREIYQRKWISDREAESLDREISRLQAKQDYLYNLSMEGQR